MYQQPSYVHYKKKKKIENNDNMYTVYGGDMYLIFMQYI